MTRHPALDRPTVSAVVRLARKYRPQLLAELGRRLDQLGFVGRPGLWSNVVKDTEEEFIVAPNDPEESATRWLALPREERRRYLHGNCDFLPCLLIADTLLDLLRKALRMGEAALVEGPEAVSDAIELPDQKRLLGDGPLLRAMRIDFPEDNLSSAGGDLSKQPLNGNKNRGGRPVKFEWDLFWAEVACYADLDSLPDRSTLRQYMLDYCNKIWGDSAPADSTIREKLGTLYDHKMKRNR